MGLDEAVQPLYTTAHASQIAGGISGSHVSNWKHVHGDKGEHAEHISPLMMKRKSLLLSLAFVTFAGVAACVGFLAGRSSCDDGLAVANTLGRVQAYMLGTNYPAAYALMSADYRRKYSLEEFAAMDAKHSLTDTFTEGDWPQAGKVVRIRGEKATLWLKIDPSFDASFEFVREQGEWRFTGQVKDYGG